MGGYECLRCGFTHSHKGNVRQHIKRKKDCKVVLLNITKDECIINLENSDNNFTLGMMKEEIKKLRQVNVLQEKDIQIKDLNEKLKIQQEEINNFKLNRLVIEELNEKLKIQQEEIDSLKLSQVHVAEEQNECVYLLLEREFITSSNKIYKFGRSKCLKNRMNSYPKQSNIVYTTPCNNSVEVERDILVLFNVMFKQRTDIGTEYFEGNENRMISTIRNYMCEQ
jgi:hypothetical protein